ncbi:polyprenyl diphosphate synthase [Halovenus marina]|uniref:polyprenyl diphosphate synthase n=1 Tax=Halovenus marina TaxID=3396621 RepID=UPI003F56E74D
MLQRVRDRLMTVYERVLESELSETPSHVAVIQDGNRRYADSQGQETTSGYHAGAETTEAVLKWCDELDIEEVTLYAFSTENFRRSQSEQETLFELIAEKLTEFADAERIHESEVRIRAIGATDRLPDHVQEAIDYAEDRTRGYDQFQLNVALAYGGRTELLSAARTIATRVECGDLAPEDVDVNAVETALYDGPTSEVDLIIRTGGDERTSNFLPWQANGNEAAVYFCTPYWPEFRRVDFLRGIRTYEHREQSWRQSRARRARALVSALGPAAVPDASRTLERLGSALPSGESADTEDVTDDAEPAD